MNTVLIIVLVLTTVSISLTSFVIVVHLIIRKLLRYPGDFIFAQSICQFFLSFHWYTKLFFSSLPENSTQCVILAIVQVFFSSCSLNLLLCLCIEVKLRLSNRVFGHSVLRRIAFYTLTASYSVFLVVFGVLNGDMGHGPNNTCTLKHETITSYIRFVGFLAASFVQIGLILVILLKIDKSYSKIARNYLIYSVFCSIAVIFPNIFKFLPYDNSENRDVFTTISLISGSCSGIMVSIPRLWNKQIWKQLNWICCRKKEGSKLEIATSQFSEFFGVEDLFESLKKKTLMQMMIVVNLRMRSNKREYVQVENEESFDEFIFEEDLFNELAVEYGTRLIKNRNLH